MSFITDMIHNMMEDPVSVRSHARKELKDLDAGAHAFREHTSRPLRMANWWQQPDRTFILTSEKLACEGQDGKGTKYMATPTSRANSLQSMLDLYDRQERAKQDAAQDAIDARA
ncbi:Hypothetical Protein FCC1311_033292 [Hondaea fermentalgiana]|uniref:Uncharacterized protein n=1 Tax=Hondaea fermentalgiana TaxID=2315210 RepID=A0A2R5G7S5_9STRA|nr:Hypothetical Protein FCC1311_033292 [Hondaea fermentalgiana]|eukprot:GBG27106.1 Hypothetical Protein FCC1311_033292 [Hondaea fermentalgiana]